MSDQPDDTVLLLLPDGGALPISRECLDDALEQAGPVREYLAEIFQERASTEFVFWKPGDPNPPPILNEHDLWMNLGSEST